MRLKHISLFFILALMSNTIIAAPQIKQNKRIVRTYKLKPETQVEVYNKYGKVEIIHWNKDSVKYVINLETRAKTKDKIEKLEALLNFSFQGGENYIRAQTLIGSESNDLLSEISNLTNAIFTIGAEVDIDFTVYMPANNKLKIENSFGDVFMGDFNPNLQIDLSHGDLRTGKLNSSSIINIRFGHAFIEYIKEGKMKVSYADMDISKSKMLDIESKVSKIKIDQIDVLSLDSRRDAYEIGSIDYLKGSSNFSNIKLNTFKKELKLKLKYGALRMDKISNLFSAIDVTSNYTDITMIIEEGASYKISITETDVSISYPKEKIQLSKELIDKEKDTNKYAGKKGNNPKSNILIEAEKGSIKIFQE